MAKAKAKGARRERGGPSGPRPKGWGQGSVFQKRPGGPWYYQIRVGDRQVRKKVGTKAAAEKTLAEARQLLRAPAEHRALVLPVVQTGEARKPARELLKKFLASRRALGRRDKTIINYRTLIEGFLSTVNCKPRVEQLVPRAATKFIEARRAEGVSSRRIKHALVAVGTMLNWAVTEGLLTVNPMPRVAKIKVTATRERRAPTEAEIKKLLEVSRPPKCGWRYDRIWGALMSSGIRVSQLVNLTWGDIDLKARTFLLRKAYAKTRKEYTMPMSEDFERVVRELWKEARGQAEVVLERVMKGGDWTGRCREVDRFPATEPRAHVFRNQAGAQLRPDNVLKHFDRCCEAAGIERHRVRPDGVVDVVDVHALRATFATRLVESGVNPQAAMYLLQHSSVEMTLGLYAKVRPGQAAEAVQGLRLLPRGKTSPARAPRKRRKATGT